MTDFNIWWEAIPALQKTFWLIGIPFTVIFLIQTVLTLVGLDADHDADMDSDFDIDTDTDVDGAEAMIGGLKFFTVRNFITFFTIFSWSGIVFSRMGITPFIVFALAAVVGLIVMLMVAYMFLGMSRMVQSGSLNIQNTVSQIGEVYIPIPADKKGKGQIQLAVQGRIEEFDAVTEDLSPLPTGAKILVLEVLSDHSVLVTAFKEVPIEELDSSSSTSF